MARIERLCRDRLRASVPNAGTHLQCGTPFSPRTMLRAQACGNEHGSRLALHVSRVPDAGCVHCILARTQGDARPGAIRGLLMQND